MFTVGYSYGTIAESMHFDDEDEARAFYEMMSERIYEYESEFGNEGEYEPSVELYEDGEQIA